MPTPDLDDTNTKKRITGRSVPTPDLDDTNTKKESQAGVCPPLI